MRILATNPALLKEPEEDLIERLKLRGERFTAFGSFSLSAAGERTELFTISAHRTLIPADALSEALGLVGDRAPSINHKHIPWPLEVGGSQNIPWNGVVLEIRVEAFESENDDKAGPLAGTIVRQITLRPS